MIEFVLLQDKKINQEFQLKIYYHVVDSYVDKDVMEVIQLLLGVISKELVSLLVIYTVIPLGADHIPYNHVIITQLDNINHVQVIHQLQLAKSNVPPNLENNILMTNTKEKVHIQFPELLKSKLKFKLMDQLKVHSLFMKIS